MIMMLGGLCEIAVMGKMHSSLNVSPSSGMRGF